MFVLICCVLDVWLKRNFFKIKIVGMKDKQTWCEMEGQESKMLLNCGLGRIHVLIWKSWTRSHARDQYGLVRIHVYVSILIRPRLSQSIGTNRIESTKPWWYMGDVALMSFAQMTLQSSCWSQLAAQTKSSCSPLTRECQSDWPRDCLLLLGVLVTAVRRDCSPSGPSRLVLLIRW